MDEPYELSPATKFVYVYEAGDFEFITPELKDTYQEVCKALAQEGSRRPAGSHPYDRFLEKLRASKQHKQWVVFGLSTYGMACGPVSCTVDICIDMNHAEEPQG